MCSPKRLVLYETKWQLIRIGCLAVNQQYGGWTSDRGTEENIKVLKDYALSPPVSIHEKQYRIYRCLNLCNAVRMGYSGQGVFDSDRSEAVKKFQAELQERMTYSSDDFDWMIDVVLFKLNVETKMSDYPLDNLVMIRNDLALRLTKNVNSSRPELAWYCSTLDDKIAKGRQYAKDTAAFRFGK